jgi:hypothetical protein
MSNPKTTPKTLTVDELLVLMNFYHTKDTWDKAGAANISIAYDDQYRDFEVITAEENVRKGRISKLQAEITAWAEGQINAFMYQGKKVNAFVLTFADDVLSIELGFESVDIAATESAATNP